MKLEAALQKQIVDYLRVMAPDVIVIASMNGGTFYNKNTMGLFQHHKKLGLLQGVPDLQLLWATYEIHPRILFLELKSPKGKVSEKQANVMADLTRIGFVCEVIKTFDQFLDACKIHGVPLKGIKYAQ